MNEEQLVAGDYVAICSGEMEGLVGIIRYTIYPELASVYFPTTVKVDRLSGLEINTVVQLSILTKSTAEEYEYCVKAKELRQLREEDEKMTNFVRRSIFDGQPVWSKPVYRDGSRNDNGTSSDMIIIDPSLFF